ncbi:MULTISPECIES: hypothetical protein [Brachybacterium]|uniref:Transcriptional initiation protein Tat n=2 Tax=Brachybacterium TaxID=43668 RepID=A0A3R8QML3_9MICO|nr:MULTISPECIES: hypothetical protein [Brachybacterium]RRR18273.1 hypothetical protein DS079_11040 [Brachybacterium paraconglomeratum]GLI30383.1 hypothetical protein BCONGLO52_12240 [Brachybacterium conglomeratum]GLK04921.1 hypothetical protein GCM10017597_17210 [Brachybacterium conglomeratum]
MTTRRTLLRAAAWTAPAALVAVAAPAIATSQLRDVLVFTNLTATVGAEALAVYANTKVMTRGGDPVPGLVVTVAVGADARTTTHRLDPWGATDLVSVVFEDQPADHPIVVQFRAEAPGVQPISGTVTVTPPAWWEKEQTR